MKTLDDILESLIKADRMLEGKTELDAYGIVHAAVKDLDIIRQRVQAPPAALGPNVLRYAEPGPVILTQAQRDDLLRIVEARTGRGAEHTQWNLDHGLKVNEHLPLVCPRCMKPHVETLTSDPNEPDYCHHVHQCTYCGLRFELYVRTRSTHEEGSKIDLRSPRLSLIECRAIILVDAFCHSEGTSGIDDEATEKAFAALVKEARIQWEAALDEDLVDEDLAPWVKELPVLAPLPMVEDRTPEQLIADGDAQEKKP